jgi:hypothetical protein
VFDKLDEALRKLLIRELPITSNEVDIDFKQPKREWSARLSRPTINLFLYEIRENNKLRQPQPFWDVSYQANGRTAMIQRKPVMTNLHYLVTAWAAEPEDEHRLLARILMVMYRFPYLPDDLVPDEVASLGEKVLLMEAQYDMLEKPSDIWSTIDNQWRPCIPVVLTVPIMPFIPNEEPIVRGRDLRVGQIEPLSEISRSQASQAAQKQQHQPPKLSEQAGQSRFLTLAGQVRIDQPVANLRLRILESGREVEVQPDGHFSVGRLREGDYTLEVSAKGHLPKQRRVTIPSAEEIVLEVD